MINNKKLKRFIEERNRFSSKAFGSRKVRDCLGPLHHLKEEVQELIEDTDDTMEWADCVLLLLDAAWRKGHSLQDLFDFAEAKLKINKKRKWKKSKNGVFNHIKEKKPEKQTTVKSTEYIPSGGECEHDEIIREIMGH